MMDLQAQEKASKIITEQADKLGKALPALRQVLRATSLEEAKQLVVKALREIADYGKDPKDL